jgi:hypothetical protein
MRPRSIMLFERVFGFTILLGAASGIWAWLHWSSMLPPGAPPQVASMMPAIMAGSLIGGVVINLLLLFFIARKGAEVAKWIFIIFFALGLLGVVRGLASPTVQMSPLTHILSIVQILIEAYCVWLLFRPDAVAWFKGERVPRDLHDTFS